MFLRLLLTVWLAIAGCVVVHGPSEGTERAADPSPSAKVFVVLRKPLGQSPLGGVFMKVTAADGSRFDLGGSVRLVGTPVSERRFVASAIRVRFVSRPVGGVGDASSGRASITFDSPYTLTPSTTSLSLSANELDQLFDGFDYHRAAPGPHASARLSQAAPKNAGFEGYVTHVRAGRATGSGVLVTTVQSKLTIAGGTVTLFGRRLDGKTIRVSRLRLRYVATNDGAKREGTLTITLTEPRIVTRTLTRLHLKAAEAAQFYDAVAT